MVNKEALFEVFNASATLPMPKPQFSLEALGQGDQSDLIRWKNRYEYAVKVHEIERVRDDVPAMGRLAASSKNSALFVTAGILAQEVKDFERAKQFFRNALELNDIKGALASASLQISHNQWQDAAQSLLAYFAGAPALTEEDSQPLVTLGICLSHLENRELPGLVALANKPGHEKATQVARILLAFALDRRLPAAASAVLAGDYQRAIAIAGKSPISVPQPSVAEQAVPTSGVSAPVLSGRITSYYPEKDYGFVIADRNQRAFYIRKESTPKTLHDDLALGHIGQVILFSPQLRREGPFDTAIVTEVLTDPREATPQPKFKPRRAPIPSRLAKLPKGDSAYARAKRAEQLDDLALAERHFKEAIDRNSEYRQSAIKDLAMLMSRQNRVQEAIALLLQHHKVFEVTRSVDNMLAYQYVKAGEYAHAGELFRKLQHGADIRTQINLARQEAFCAFALKNFEGALKLLGHLLHRSPEDMQTQSLIERVKVAQDTAAREPDSKTSETEALYVEALTSGLSPFAKHLLAACDYRGVDERSRGRGYFEDKDFAAVDRLLEEVRGRRPREKAIYSLTLAAMVKLSPENAGNRSTHEYLRRYFTFMGEAAIYDNLHRDTSRCYLTEALSLAVEDDVETPLSFLLATYLITMPSPGELSSEVRSQKMLKLFEGNPAGLSSLEADFPYYSSLSQVATKRLAADLKKNSVLRDFLATPTWLSKARVKEQNRCRTEQTQLATFALQPLGSGALQDIAGRLRELAQSTRFELDKQRVRVAASLVGDAASYWVEQDYLEREAKQARLLGGLTTFESEINDSPTKLSVESLLPLSRHVKQNIIQNFDAFVRTALPEIQLRNVLGEDYYVPEQDGSMAVSLELGSKTGGAPVESIEILVAEESGLELLRPGHSPEMLRGGEKREIQLLVRPSRTQIEDQAFTLRVHLRYRTRSGDVVNGPEETVPIRIGTADEFIEIPNPYNSYSGGKVVDDPKMFVGRQELLSRIKKEVLDGPVGQCFVLYGQKRSGKSSILRQLEKQISAPSFAVSLTLGEVDVGSEAEQNFVQVCIDKIEDRLQELLGTTPMPWPTASAIHDRPIDSFKIAFRQALKVLGQGGQERPRLILLVDEFTYLYEYIKEGIVPPTFMRHWKALLQLELFSAVVVGQDSMPKFKQAYTNEFGVTHDERITYLSPAEAQELADDKILLGTKSRYRGNALARLNELTACSPFYLQIFCDRLVRHLNEKLAPFITEADIDIVARQLIVGGGALPIEKFDPLITAAGESVAEASRETYLQLLVAIAHLSNRLGGARLADIPAFSRREILLQDMQEREVISADAAQRVSIRVGLFAEWLRVNYSFQATS
jgi:tetratricopeptide (TPR) repeat protein